MSNERAARSARRSSRTLDDLERMFRRALVVPLAAPIFLLTGLGLGKLTTHAVALPEHVPVVHGEATSREHLEVLSGHMQRLREQGDRTAEYVVLYRDHVAPVETSLRRWGVSDSIARRVAWPLVEYSYRQALDPATVVSVLLLESGGRPRATSPVGARGLMQVMPMHKGRWQDCGPNLYDIEDNICYGTSILAWYLRRFNGDERRALLGYNGCILGTNTPDCFRYPDRVQRLSLELRSEWESRAAPMAASP